jgi:hypothetical protein
MKRSFKVATVFTGAAACAAAFAPTAGAATVAPGATARITPEAITANDCTAGEWDWAHMEYTAAERHPTDACYGGSGIFDIAGNKRFTEFCPGGNFGWLVTSFGSFSYSAGAYTIPLYSAIVYAVGISGHSDPSARC